MPAHLLKKPRVHAQATPSTGTGSTTALGKKAKKSFRREALLRGEQANAEGGALENLSIKQDSPPQKMDPQQPASGQTRHHKTTGNQQNQSRQRAPAGSSRGYFENKPAPSPSEAYKAMASQPSVLLKTPAPRHQLLVLNVTILLRNFKIRPNTKTFLEYIFRHFYVMVWTSATRVRADASVNHVFTPEQKDKLLGLWSRTSFDFEIWSYGNRAPIYKTLSSVWEADWEGVEEYYAADSAAAQQKPDQHNPDAIQVDTAALAWDQTNTILLDDIKSVASAEPHNLVLLPIFEPNELKTVPLNMARKFQAENVLTQVMAYLEHVRLQTNVSAYMREHPFKAKRRF